MPNTENKVGTILYDFSTRNTIPEGWIGDWQIVNNTLQSIDINDNQSSFIEFELDNVPNQYFVLDILSNISSEASYDKLVLYIDDQYQDSISGSITALNWDTLLFSNNSTIKIKLAYTKDSSVSKGTDNAWINYIKIQKFFDSTYNFQDILYTVDCTESFYSIINNQTIVTNQYCEDRYISTINNQELKCNTSITEMFYPCINNVLVKSVTAKVSNEVYTKSLVGQVVKVVNANALLYEKHYKVISDCFFMTKTQAYDVYYPCGHEQLCKVDCSCFDELLTSTYVQNIKVINDIRDTEIYDVNIKSITKSIDKNDSLTEFWGNDCNTTGNWDSITYNTNIRYQHPDGILETDGSSIYVNELPLSTGQWRNNDIYLTKNINIDGDFELQFDITIPNYVVPTSAYRRFAIRLDSIPIFYFYQSSSSFYIDIAYNEYTVENITFPYNCIFKVIKVGDVIYYYINGVFLYSHTMYALNGLTTLLLENINYSNTTLISTPKSVKINDISIWYTGIRNNTLLSNVSFNFENLTSITMIPSFNSTVFQYNIDLPAIVGDSYTVNCATSDYPKTVYINGVEYTSGVTSSPIALNSGNNSLTIQSTIGGRSSYYNFNIFKPPQSSSIADIDYIYYGTSTTFSPDIYEYNLNYTFSTKTISFRVYPTEDFTTITINGTSVTPKVSTSFDLVDGNNVFNIISTSEDGTATKQYTYNVFRQSASNISAITLLRVATHAISVTPTTVWNFIIDGVSTTGDIYATKNVDSKYACIGLEVIKPLNGTVTLNGKVLTNSSTSRPKFNTLPVRIGENIFEVISTAQDGVTKSIYKLHINVVSSYNYEFGTGTAVDPFQVWTPEDVDGIRHYISYNYWTPPVGVDIKTYFIQMQDIDMGGMEWTPIPEFYSKYNGNNFTISNLVINSSTGGYVGFFGHVEADWEPNVATRQTIPYASITNFNLTNVVINTEMTMNNTQHEAGILAGFSSGSLYNCHVQGEINAWYNNSQYNIFSAIGGLIGNFGGSYMYQCSSNVNIILHSNIRPGNRTDGTGSPWHSIGGLLGKVRHGEWGTYEDPNNPLIGIQQCFSVGNIVWDYTVLNQIIYPSGWLSPPPPEDEYIPLLRPWVENPENRYIGGLIGGTGSSLDIEDGVLFIYKDCYSRVNIWMDCSGDSGGLVGWSHKTVQNCYSTGYLLPMRQWLNFWMIMYCSNVRPNMNTLGCVGSIISQSKSGQDVPKPSNMSCYYDYQTLGFTSPNVDNGNAKSTEEMKSQGTFVDWDFVNVWGIDPAINDGYPYLKMGGMSEKAQCKVIGFPFVSSDIFNNRLLAFRW